MEIKFQKYLFTRYMIRILAGISTRLVNAKSLYMLPPRLSDARDIP